MWKCLEFDYIVFEERLDNVINLCKEENVNCIERVFMGCLFNSRYLLYKG